MQREFDAAVATTDVSSDATTAATLTDANVTDATATVTATAVAWQQR